MAFLKKAGSMLGRTVGNCLSQEMTSSQLFSLQVIRSMSSSKLFVGGLSFQADDQSLLEAFNKYGDVAEARIIVDRETGRSRGFGFVTYSSVEEASAAIQALDQQELHGRTIRVDYANDRTRGGFGGGSGGSYGGGYGGGSGGSYGGGYGGGSGGGYGGGSGGGYGGGSGGGYGGGSGGGYGGGGGGYRNADGYGGNYGSGGFGGNSGGQVHGDGQNFDSGVTGYGSATGAEGNSYAGVDNHNVTGAGPDEGFDMEPSFNGDKYADGRS